MREDVLLLADIYADEGYAHADINPRIDENPSELKADITYMIDKEKRVYIERIEIRGNTKTRDKVIRRQFKVHEQDLYSGRKLKRSIRNLYRLDFFRGCEGEHLEGKRG